MANAGPFALPGFTWGAAGVWTLVAMVAIALIKVWPIIAKQAIDARAQLRKESREDLHECHQRLDAYQGELATIRDAVTALRINLNDAISAYRILDIEVETHLPDSTALKQARALMSTAFAVAPSSDSHPEPRRD